MVNQNSIYISLNANWIAISVLLIYEKLQMFELC